MSHNTSGNSRGRGINNAPAWMSRGNNNNGGDSNSNKNSGPQRNNNDARSAPRDRSPPSRGGGGGPPPPHYNNRGGNRDFRDHRGGPPPPHHHNRNYRGPPPPRHGHRGGPPPPRRGPPPRHRNHPDLIFFDSWESERAWLDQRRTARRLRQHRDRTKFDQMPTAAQTAHDAALQALSNPAATDFSGVAIVSASGAGAGGLMSQQTRHARRIYVGNLPPHGSITETQIHDAFWQALQKAAVQPLSQNDEDPILSTYINHERRFSFVEFKSVEMATAAMQLDGLEIQPGWPCKVKRPNDYNPLTAPPQNANVPVLDVSRLGIIGSTVPDGPNKIFIGGLHYYLNDEQVRELLAAFGTIKAFHLVKETPEATTSKGYAFVEYLDPSVTHIAVQGLNGMDIGNDRTLTARLAGERGALGGILGTEMGLANGAGNNAAGAAMALPGMPLLPNATATNANAIPRPGVPPPDKTIVAGYDVEYLVDASLGKCTMPTAIQYRDALGMPLTRIVAAHATTAANAASSGSSSTPVPPPPSSTTTANPTNQLRLDNMVTEDDIQSPADMQALEEEIREECQRYGDLQSVAIQKQDRTVMLTYQTTQQAQEAHRQLQGRQFGEAKIVCTYV